MASKDGRAQIWYADGSGNVTGYTESVGEIAGTIIEAYNEHFGTDIAIWTPETKSLQMGGSVPNWDAYEKIEIILFTDDEWYLIKFEPEKYIGVLAYEDGNTYSLGVNTTGGETPEPILYNKNRERIGVQDISDSQYETMTEKLIEYNGQSVYFEENPSYSDIPNSAKIINI